jgi:radical SAM superfamily enzyme YgiQ (UPF0313 family)
MRVYLINPSNPVVSLTKSTRWNKLNKYRVWKPLGLLTLARLTPDDWELRIIDENLGPVDYEALPRPDLVGLTAFTSQATRAYELAREFRNRGVPTVIGGIHASMCVDEALRFFDAVVTGEAERQWGRVLEDVRHGRLQRRYEGGLVPVEEIPSARHDLLPGHYYFGSVQTTRHVLQRHRLQRRAVSSPSDRERPRRPAADQGEDDPLRGRQPGRYAERSHRPHQGTLSRDDTREAHDAMDLSGDN